MFGVKGFGIYEGGALNVAVTMILIVPFNQMAWSYSPRVVSIPYFCATTLFICVGFKSVFCADKTPKRNAWL
jgi:hypothetical protein